MLSALMPAEPFEILRRELAGRVEPASCGSWLTKSAILFDGEVFWMSCCDRTTSGVGAWKPSRATREPVTMIWSDSAASVLSAAEASSCASAGAACTSASAVIAAPKRPSGPRTCSISRISAVPCCPSRTPQGAFRPVAGSACLMSHLTIWRMPCSALLIHDKRRTLPAAATHKASPGRFGDGEVTGCFRQVNNYPNNLNIWIYNLKE